MANTDFAVEQGKKAKQRGDRLIDNPYDPRYDKEKYAAWRRGWKSG